MKKIIAATALAAALPLSAFAAPSDAGCGLGSVIFADQPDTLVSNVLAATTNATSGNQTFGMTTGTLNCNEKNSLLAMESFINNNLDTLAVDAARGEGETLDTLAAMWGMDEQDKARFAQTTKENYASIFASDSTTATEVLENLNQVISNDSQLAGYSLS